MGLLGDSWDDPKSMATLQLAAGLLGPGGFGTGLGRGLLGYQGSMAASQEQQLKQEQLSAAKQAQMIAALKFEQDREGFNIGQDIFGRPRLPTISMPGMPQQQVMPQQQSAPQQAAPMPGAPQPAGQPAPGQPTAQPAPRGGIDFEGLGIDRTAAGLTATGNPAYEKLGAMIQEAQKPLVNRGYGINKWNPVTKQYDLDEGSRAGIETVEKIKGDVAAAHKMVKIENPDGTFRYVRESEQIAASDPKATFSSPALRQQVQQDAGIIPATPGAPAKPFPLSPVRASPLTGGQSTFGKKQQEEQGQQAGELEKAVNANAESAMHKIAQNNKMIELLPEVTTGPLAKQVTTLKMLGQSLGIDVGDPSNNQEFEKYAIKGALEGAKQIYGARLTNQDVMSQIASNPGTTMGEKAMYELIKYDNIVQQRHLDKQEAYFTDDGPKNTFEMRFNREHPFMGISAPQPGQTAAQSAPGAVMAPKKALPQVSSKLKPNGKGGFDYVGP